jgi:peptidoglycan/LPS O-acetylase OafA/YrhL
MLYDAIFNGDGTLNPPLWTLKIEFIGSIYLLAYYSIKPRKYDFIFLILCSCALFYFYDSDSIYYITILSGGWLGGMKLKPPLILITLFFLGLYFGSFVFENKIFDWLPNVHIFDNKNFYNAIGACLVVASIINGYGKRFFLFSTIQFLGRISFSLYLLHFLILCSLACGIYVFLPVNKWAIALNFILYLSTCLFFAKFFTRYIDKASVSTSRKFSYFLFKK